MGKEHELNQDIKAAVELYKKLRAEELSLAEIRFILQEMPPYVPAPTKQQ